MSNFSLAVHLNILVFITFTVLIVNTVVFLHFFHEENHIALLKWRVALSNVFTVWNVLWEAFLSLPSLLKFPVVSINKIHRRCCRDCRRDRNFSISATLVAAVVLVATIAEECVSIYRHRRRNTFFDDSGDSSDGSDYMETGLYANTWMGAKSVSSIIQLVREFCLTVILLWPLG